MSGGQDMEDVMEVALLGLVLMELDDEDEYVDPLEGLDRHDAADVLDGTGRWARIRVPHAQRFWERTGRNLSSRAFLSYFRCMRSSFCRLVTELYGTTDLCRADGTRGPVIDPCERVAIFMHRCGTGNGVRQTAINFEVSEGSVTEITMHVAHRVLNVLASRYVTWPDPEEQSVIASQWETEKALRNVIGAIDGSHIRIPAVHPDLASQYYNYKQFFSIVLLAIVDHRGMFRWFASGAPGSCGDNGIFQKCPFYRRVLEDQALPQDERVVVADGACILGDSAFAESDWMRTPINAPSSRRERYFNYKHSSQRFRVEHSFGRLKSKFNCMGRGLLFNLDNASIIIDACVVLYNFLLVHEGDYSERKHVDPDQTRNGTGRRARGEGGAGAAARTPRQVEMDYLDDAGYLEEDWGAPGSRADRARLEDERRFQEAAQPSQQEENLESL